MMCRNQIERSRIWIGVAVLSLAAIALYATTAGFGFLHFDDPDYTFANPFVRNGFTWSGVKEAFTNVRHGAIYMPVTWLSYMADIAFFGPGPGAHHLVNVFLHATNALLLFALCRQMGNSSLAADQLPVASFPLSITVLPAIAFWALHPQRVEAVAWIASRKELLWAFFTLIGLSAWRANRCLLTYACCALACLSKPTAMVFPFLALLVTLPSDMIRRPRPCAYLPLFLLAALTGALAVFSQTHPAGMAVKELFYAGLGERLLNAAVAIGLDVGQMVVPVGLHLDYRSVPGGWPVDGTLGLVIFAVCIVALVGMAFACKTVRSSRLSCGKDVLWGFLWFLLPLLPTLGLFGSFGEHARADRFLYVPAMFLPLVAACILGRGGVPLSGYKGVWRLVLATGCVAVVAMLAVPLIRSYRSDETAFARTLAYDPDHGRALAHVGEARCAAAFDPAKSGVGRTAALDEGIELLRRSQRLRPCGATAGKFAYALMKRGRAADWREIRGVVRTDCVDERGQALEALGTAELQDRQWSLAVAYLQRSICAPKRFYSAEDARLKLAFALHNGGKRADARRLFEILSRSSRTDIAARADQSLIILNRSPRAILFW